MPLARPLRSAGARRVTLEMILERLRKATQPLGVTRSNSPAPPASEAVVSLAMEDGRNRLKIRIAIDGVSRDFQPPLVIGRDENCDLRLDDWRVERHHAEIYEVGTLWWVRDLATVEGTYLNGELLEAEPLRLPSELRLGANGPNLFLESTERLQEGT